MADADVAGPGSIAAQICYARPGLEIYRNVSVKCGATLQQAIVQSGILDEISGIDLSACHVGVYSKLKSLDTMVRDGDRIEIYRPLIADPMESRRRRAQKKKESAP